MKELAIPLAQFLLLGGFCLGLYRIANGNLKKKVDRLACHDAQKAIKENIKALERHLDTRFDDLKDRIRNGKET